MSDYEFTEFVGRVLADQCRDAEDKDAHVAVLEQRVREQREEIRQLRSEVGTLAEALDRRRKEIGLLQQEVANLEYFYEQSVKELGRQIDQRAELPRALAQLQQMFPGLDVQVSTANLCGCREIQA